VHPLAVDGIIFEGLLEGVVCEGLAFLLRQERCLHRIVDRGGDLRTCSLRGHRRMFSRRTNGGRQMLELANPGTTKSNRKKREWFDASEDKALGQPCFFFPSPALAIRPCQGQLDPQLPSLSLEYALTGGGGATACHDSILYYRRGPTRSAHTATCGRGLTTWDGLYTGPFLQ
jgi:hypothetical protein